MTNDPVIDWLLDSDPSIRWQVMRDLIGAPADVVAAVRARRQGDGRWLLDVRHRNTLHEELAGVAGAPNRWVTLRARLVLHWYEGRH